MNMGLSHGQDEGGSASCPTSRATLLYSMPTIARLNSANAPTICIIILPGQ